MLRTELKTKTPQPRNRLRGMARWVTVGLCGTLATSLPCRGQEKGSPSLTEQSLSDLMNIRVYGASRYSQPAAEAPVSITVVTRDQIDKAGFRTLADILRSVRGLYISYDRLYSYVGVRGFSNAGDLNTRVLLMVDGHRLNDAIFEQAMVGTEFAIDVDLIERVEVIRGPASSLYGTNAIFAEINVITRKASDVHGEEISGDAGSFNSYRGRLTYGGTVAGIDLLMSATFFGSKGNNKLYYPEYDSPETNNGIASHGDDDQSVNLLTTASSHGLRFQAAYNTREKGDPTGSWDDVFNDSRNRESDGHGYLDLRYEHPLGANSTLMARTYFDRYMYDGTFVNGTPDDRIQNIDLGRGESWGLEVQSTTNLHQRYKLISGFEYRNDFRQQVVNFDLLPSSLLLDVDHPSFVAAPYIEAEIPLGKGLSFDPSVREDYNPRVGWIISPRGALNYRVHQNTHLALIYGESFRSPNAYELYYFGDAGRLKAERIAAWEGDWDQTISPQLEFSLSAFSNRMHDFIGMSSDEVTGAAFHNIGSMAVAGGETEVRGHLPAGITAIASYGLNFYQRGPDGSRLVNSPKHLGKLDTNVPLWDHKLFATLDAQYTSRRSTLMQHDVSPYTVVNATILGRELMRNLELSAGIYNAFDKRVYDPGAQQHVQDAIQQDGRNYRAKLVWSFGGK